MYIVLQNIVSCYVSIRTCCVGLNTVLHVVVYIMGIAAQSLEAVKRLATFAFSFYTQCLQGCDQGFFLVKKGKRKKKQPFPYRESNPGRLGENQES